MRVLGVRAAAALLMVGVAMVGCNSGSSGGTLIGTILAPSFGSAPRADVSGQENVTTGKLGAGTTFTFSAIKGNNYNISVSTDKPSDVTVDIFSRSGSQLKGKSFTTNGGIGYVHEVETQHVLVLLRPTNPLNTDINITSLKVVGVGSFSQTTFSVNLVVAGDDFSGYGQFNDLKTAQDRAAFSKAIMAKMQALLGPSGIAVTWEGFTLQAAQIKPTQPFLLDDANRAVAKAGETVNAQGFADVDTSDLDRYGSFGFAASDPVATRANGLDVFLIHHFSTEGVVGLSPRPGTALKGNGAGTALCVGAFLKANNQFFGRSVDDIATVMTHEIGHFLGLMHTTTFDPNPNKPTRAIDDGLTDTPKSTNLDDKNGDGIVGIGDGCQDENNVMFWQAGLQTDLTPMQIRVIKTTLSAMEH